MGVDERVLPLGVVPEIQAVGLAKLRRPGRGLLPTDDPELEAGLAPRRPIRHPDLDLLVERDAGVRGTFQGRVLLQNGETTPLQGCGRKAAQLVHTSTDTPLLLLFNPLQQTPLHSPTPASPSENEASDGLPRDEPTRASTRF